MQVLAVALAMLFTVLALAVGQINNPSANYDTAAVVNSVAPESVIYSSAAAINTVTATRLEHYRLANVEQSLVDVCRATYTMAQINSCSNIDESLTWAFLFQNGNSGTLNSILAAASSNSFSCAGAAAYGTYLLKSAFSDLTGYNYNLNIYNSMTHITAPISGQTDPCAYADIVS